MLVLFWLGSRSHKECRVSHSSGRPLPAHGVMLRLGGRRGFSLLSPRAREHEVKPSLGARGEAQPWPPAPLWKGGFLPRSGSPPAGRRLLAPGGLLGAETSTGGTGRPVLSPLPAVTHSPKWPGLCFDPGLGGICRSVKPPRETTAMGGERSGRRGMLSSGGCEWDLNLLRSGAGARGARSELMGGGLGTLAGASPRAGREPGGSAGDRDFTFVR